MTAAAIRDKLYNYIRVADDKKVKAIYTMLENEIEEETAWWTDKKFIAALDKDFEEWQGGKAKGYSMEEVSHSINSKRDSIFH